MDKLPSTTLTSKQVASLDVDEEFGYCGSLVGVPPDARNEAVLIARGVGETSRLLGYGANEWETLGVVSREEAKEGSTEAAIERAWEHALDFLREHHGDDFVLLDSERPPHETILDVFPNNPIEKDDIGIIESSPGHIRVEPVVVLVDDRDVIGLFITRVPTESGDHPLQYALGFDESGDRWEVVSETRKIDTDADAPASRTAREILAAWITDRYETERIFTVENPDG